MSFDSWDDLLKVAEDIATTKHQEVAARLRAKRQARASKVKVKVKPMAGQAAGRATREAKTPTLATKP